MPIFYYAATLYSRIDSLYPMAELTFSERYPSLSEMGLFPELLLAVAGDSDSCSDIENLHIPRSNVTNQTMLELTIQFCKRKFFVYLYYIIYLYWRRVYIFTVWK